MAHILSLSVSDKVLRHPSLCDPSIDTRLSTFNDKAAAAFAPHGKIIVVGKAHC